MLFRLIGHRFKKIAMNIDVEPKREMEIEGNFSLKLSFDEEEKDHCVAEMTAKIICLDDPENFFIEVVFNGFFECADINTEEDKQSAHAKAHAAVFPYVQNLISQLTVNAGVQPLIVPCPDFSPDEVTDYVEG